MNDQIKIPCMFIRGGTSRGPYFLKKDLPSDIIKRDKTLLAVMGSPDLRQIDGLGGAEPVKSKVAIIDKSKDCLLYTSPSPRDRQKSRMPSSA